MYTLLDAVLKESEKQLIMPWHKRKPRTKLLAHIKGVDPDCDKDVPTALGINMLKVLKTFKEVGYEYMVMPDHVPAISGPEPRRVGFAYAYGYIHAADHPIGTKRKKTYNRC